MKFAPMLALALIAATAAMSAPPPSSSPDALLKAINFALLGNDDKAYVWKDRTDCVVVSDSTAYNYHEVEVLRLNNVDASRVRLEPSTLTYQDGHVEHSVKVDLHGEETIREFTREALTPEGKQWAQPFTTSSDWTYTRQTAEFDRIARAWKYIYTHGCRGAHSSF